MKRALQLSGLRRRVRAVGWVVLCGVLAAAGASAATRTWTGLAGTGDWGTAANWSAAPASGDSVVFNAASANNQFLINLGMARTNVGMTFSSTGTSGFTFGNSGVDTTLTLNGGITNSNAATQTFLAELTLIVATNSTWSATGDLDFHSATRLSANLTFSGAGDQNLYGVVTNFGGNRTLTNNSTGAVTLTDVNLSDNNTARTLTFTGTGTTVVSGVVANGGTGAGNLTKLGTGTLILNGANTYSGTTTLTAGTLLAGSDTALGTSGVTLGGGTLGGSGTGTRTLGNLLTLTASSSIGGTQDLTFTGALTQTAATTLTVSNTGTTTFGDINLSNNNTGRTLTLAGAGNVVVDGVIANGGTTAGNLVKSGSGTLTLLGANTYTGTTTLSAGTLLAGHNNALGSGTVNLSGGTLGGAGAGTRTLGNALNLTASSTIGGAQDLQFTGTLTQNNANTTLTVDNTGTTEFAAINLSQNNTGRTFTLAGAGAVTVTGVIGNGGSGAGSLVYSGSSVLNLAGANTYTGVTTINSGVLSASTLAAGGASSSIGASTNVAANLVLNGGTLRYTGAGATTDRLFTLGAAGGTLDASGTGNLTFGNSGAIAFTGSGARTLTLTGTNTGTNVISSVIGTGTGGATSIEKTGTGTWALVGNNTYTGTTTVSEGVLAAGLSANALGTGAATVNLAGGTLQLANDTGLNFARNTTVSADSTVVTNRINAGTAVTHTLGTLSIGTHTLNVDAGSLNANGGLIFGATTLTGNGTFNVGGNTLLTLGALNDGGAARTFTKSGAGTLTLGTAATSIVNGTTVNVTGGTLNSNQATALGSLAAVNLSPGATVNLGASQTFGALGGTGGTLNLNANTLTVGSTNNLSSSYSGVITGSGALVKAGTGTLTLAGNNNFTGNTTVNAGTLNVQHHNALGTGTGNITVASGATLALQGGVTVSSRPLALSGTLESVSGANHWNGNITLGGNASLLSTTAGQLLTVGPGDFSGLVTLGSNTLTVGGAGDVLINSIVGATGNTGGFIKTGSGTVTFYGDENRYTGDTDVRDGTLVLDTLNFPMVDKTILGNLIIGDGIGAANSAVVRYGSGVANNKIANTSQITIKSDGLLDLNLRDDTVGAITLEGGRIVTGTGVLELNGNITTLAHSQTAEINGVLSLGGVTRTFSVADGAAASDLTINSKINFGGITKTGAGTMTITSDNTIGYGGITTVSEGVLNIRHANALGQHANGDASSGTVVASGAALQVQNSLAVGAERLTLSGTGIANDGALRSLGGDNSWAGPIVLSAQSRINTDAGTLTLNGTISGSNQNLIVGGAGTTVLNGDIGTGSGTLTKDGTGTAIVTGNNTFSGATTVQNGVLNIRHNNALGSTLVGTTVNTGGELQLQNNLAIGNESLSLSGTGYGSNTGALRNVSGDNTYGGAITVAAASTRINSDSGTLTLSNTVALGSNTLAVGGASNTTITGQLTGANASVLTKDGAGTLTLSNSINTFSGDVNVNAGTLTFGAGNSVNSSAIDLSVASGATVDLVSFAQSLGTIAGTGLIDFNNGGQLSLASTSTWSGSFSGSGTIVVGSGVTLTLASNIYAPNVNIILAGGTLNMADGEHVFGNLTVTGNSSLNFSGTSTFEIGNLFFSSLDYTLSILNWVDNQDFFYSRTQPGDRFQPPLNQVTFGPSGGPPWDGSHTRWQDWDTQITPVPEPSTYGAMLMGAGLLFFGYRRRRAALERRAKASSPNP